MKLHGIGVEVGVFRGWHARLILDTWKGGYVYAVDPWVAEHVERNGVCVDPIGVHPDRPSAMRVAKELAENAIRVHSHRCTLLHMTSATAAKQFAPLSLAWVYVDGRHYKEGVLEDLECWYPLVKEGGVIAGHDYADQPKHFFEVKETVDGFFNYKENVRPLDTMPIPSWYVIKGYPDETGTRPIEV